MKLLLARVVTTAALVAAAAPASAQDPADLGRLKLEDLLQLSVTSVARKPQPLATAPAAIFVMTHDEIRRSGLSSLPEVLRLAPGVQVAKYSNSKWSVSARGMGAYYSNKLLVLIDGRSIYTPDFSGVYWDLHEVPLDDVERIEVVRGPGGTMWGANAVNGVINVITRSAAETQGALVSVTSGTSDRAVASVRYGGRIGDGVAVRAYTKVSDRAADNGDPYDDSLRLTRGGFRADGTASRLTWTLEGDAYAGREAVAIVEPSLAAPFTAVREDRISTDGAYVLGRVVHSFGERSEVALRTYVDHNRRDEYIHGFTSDTFDVDLQHRVPLAARHDGMWGVEYRRTVTNIDNRTPVMSYLPEWSERDMFSGFVQDEFAIAPRLSVTGGVKVEHHETVGTAVEPSARAMWTPAGNHRLWGGVARGVRTPSLADQIATFDYGVIPPSAATKNFPLLIRVAGDPRQSDPESVVAYEIGYRSQWWSALAIDITAFHNRYSHLGSYSRGPVVFSTDGGIPHLGLVSTHQNLAAGTSNGVEAAATWTPTPRWTMTGTTTFLATSLHMTDPTVDPGNTFLVLMLSPGRQARLTNTVNLTSSLDLDATLYWNGAWQRGGVAAYARTDLRAGWKIDRRVTLDAGVQNLFDDRHREAADYLFERATDVARSAYARLTWSF